MPKIKNWSQGHCPGPRSVKERGALAGIACEWEHDETGDTIAIRVDFDNGKRYDIIYNDEAVTAKNTYSDARESVIDTLRKRPQGI